MSETLSLPVLPLDDTVVLPTMVVPVEMSWKRVVSAAFQNGHDASIPNSFVDGTATTILVVEANKAVPWTKPEDWTFDPKQPLAGLSREHRWGFLVLFHDRMLWQVRRTIDPDPAWLEPVAERYERFLALSPIASPVGGSALP